MKISVLTKLLPVLILSACSSSSSRVTAKTTPSIYFYESDANGFNTKNFFFDNGEEVVAFDSQFTPELAKKSIDFLRTKTPNPITYLVITHPNPDKFNGISEFKKAGAKVVASNLTKSAIPGVHDYKKYYFVQMAKMFTDATYPRLETIDVTFDTDFEIKLKNGDLVNLKELQKPGVSSNQTVAHVFSQNALIVGDLVHHKAHEWLEGGIVGSKPTPNIASWIEVLQQLQGGHPAETVVYGARGESAVASVALPEQISYLKKADAIVAKYVKKLGKKKAELKGPKAGDHHKAIAKEFEKTFPDYALPYMIEYGVYGLAQSKL